MTSFEDRWKHLFDQLKEAEKQANFATQTSRNAINLDDRRIVRRQVRQTRAEMRQFRGKDSIFKRPEAPLAQCVAPRTMPGFRKNPDKWVCYNLENVPEVSERSNSEAAAICLKELDKQSEESNHDDTDTKITFKQPICISKPVSSSNDSKKICYKNTTVIYPEYVVGQKEKVKTRKDKPRSEDPKTTQLRLDHLIEDEDNE